MKKLIDLDEEILEEAKETLGAASYKETVNAGLRAIIAQAAREREIARFTSADADDMENEQVLASAWR